ncbi:MAG: peptidase T [Bacteroidia bacterium]|nr:MAG: peptidase T [Bacteroidia bacterium]
MRIQDVDSARLREELVERFRRYAAIPSQSVFGSRQVPSSEGQLELARLLRGELEEMGAADISLSEYGVLIGHLPGNSERPLPPVAFVAHLDTVDVNLSPSIEPRIVHHGGGDICLNEEDGIFIREAEHPEIARYVGQDILVGNGHSVLGADDKAAIASIMTAARLVQEDEHLAHGDIYLVFVPDEEVGLVGAKHIDFSRLPVKFAYTLDCCELGEVVYETFNAGSARVHIQGVSAHPMSAKGVMVNPTLVAADFANYFNRLETPENTDGTDGYIWIDSINSNQSTATVSLNIRDHSRAGYEAKKAFIAQAVELLQKRYPRAKITLEMADVYGNIRDAIDEESHFCVDYIYEAMRRLGITPKTMAMRGGTDGSYISTRGIPTPNFFTGAHNFHSNCEFLPIPSFEMSCRMVLTLLEIIAEG